MTNPPDKEHEGQINKILSLIYDPTFVEFETEQESPSIFNAVGRTYTETWHSALLGWLLDAQSSHSLGVFPLRRLLLLLASENSLSVEQRAFDLHELIAAGDFSNVRVRPNERELAEVSVGDMRFDILVDRIKQGEWAEVQILIEVKVKAKIDIQQNDKYINYIAQRRMENEFILPVYVAPTNKLLGTSEQVLGNETWIGVDYQNINDEIIEPCLQHPSISAFGKFTLTEYIKTLKYRQQGKEPLATTQKERDMVAALMERHEPAIRALYEILSQGNEDFQPLSSSSAGTTASIKLKIADVVVEATSVPKLYHKVLKMLYDEGYLANLELPIETGTKRYLISRNPVHQRGNEFIKAVGYEGYYMEANKNRDSALKDLAKLLTLCGLQMQVIE